MEATCPKCNTYAKGYKLIDIIFGMRMQKRLTNRHIKGNLISLQNEIESGTPLIVIKGKYIPQSWCKKCRRGKTIYLADEIKYYKSDR